MNDGLELKGNKLTKHGDKKRVAYVAWKLAEDMVVTNRRKD